MLFKRGPRRRTAHPYIDMVKILCNRISAFGKDKFTWQKLSFAFFSRASVKLIFSLCLLLPSLPAQAIETVLMPWQLFGWDAEFVLRHKDALQTMHQAIKTSWLQNSQSFDRWVSAQGRTASLNQQRLSQSLEIGSPRLTLSSDTYLIPILCPVGDNLIFALQLVDLKSQLMLAGTQLVAPIGSWKQQLAREEAFPLLQALPNLMQELEIQSSRTWQAEPTDALKLRLGLLRGSDDSREGAHQCLNLLLAHSLLAEQRILASLAGLEATHIHDQMQLPRPPQRHSRFLLLDWGRIPLGSDSFKLAARWGEGVLGGSIAQDLFDQLSLKPRLKAPPKLQKLLLEEKEHLRLSDLPQVSKIYKAWIYLDRGRAYGLDLDDRLYLNEGGRRVKGHVVGFFGPKLGIVSPRGYPVNEGAILYIRKGQRDVKVGDTFSFDPTRFPTPWPPVAQPSAEASSTEPDAAR